jgi:hypothetical protein
MFRLILVFIFILFTGCDKTGYIVIISVDHFKYNDLQQIELMLKEKGFETVVWERKKDIPKYFGEVYSLFGKKVSNKPYHFVDVYLNYVKDVPNSVARNLRIEVHNIYMGMNSTELKDEIDKIGDLIYQELVNRVGKGNVLIDRKAHLSGALRM